MEWLILVDRSQEPVAFRTKLLDLDLQSFELGILVRHVPVLSRCFNHRLSSTSLCVA